MNASVGCDMHIRTRNANATLGFRPTRRTCTYHEPCCVPRRKPMRTGCGADCPLCAAFSFNILTRGSTSAASTTHLLMRYGPCEWGCARSGLSHFAAGLALAGAGSSPYTFVRTHQSAAWRLAPTRARYCHELRCCAPMAHTACGLQSSRCGGAAGAGSTCTTCPRGRLPHLAHFPRLWPTHFMRSLSPPSPTFFWKVQMSRGINWDALVAAAIKCRVGSIHYVQARAVGTSSASTSRNTALCSRAPSQPT